MSTEMIIELVGYLGSFIVLVSFLMSSVVKLRVVNTIGALIFTTYAVIIHSYPTALMNACLIVINIYYLVRLIHSDKHYSLVAGAQGDAYLRYFLEHYQADIRQFFPQARLDGADTAYMVCSNGTPVSVLLGSRREDGTLEIQLDYSTPAYRDCSAGAYLYSQLPAQGIRRVVFPYRAEKHAEYLRKMGFTERDGAFVKEL